MWILTREGFFSVVQKPGQTDLTVRSRSIEDLGRLLERHLQGAGPIRSGEGTDYPYRVTVDRQRWAEAVAAMSAEVDYPNFKDEVRRTQGYGRASVYGEVWHALLALEVEP